MGKREKETGWLSAARVHLHRAVPSASALASASASHRSVIKNDEGKYIMGARYRSTARRDGAGKGEVHNASRARARAVQAEYKLLARCTELDGN